LPVYWSEFANRVRGAAFHAEVAIRSGAQGAEKKTEGLQSPQLQTWRSHQMTQKRMIVKPVAAAVGVAFVSSLAVSTTVVADDNPFAAIDLDNGYLLAGGDKDEEGKCGEGSCGEDKGDEGSCGGEEGSCGGDSGEEGSCGGDSGEEGSCGGDKGEEGSCGGHNA
jgi:uncharacterized low-complexity protein